MAMSQESSRALDQLRQKLSHLSASISALRTDLERTDPLPSWPQLQSAGHALAFNLDEFNTTFNGHRQFLREAHAYPLNNFPGHTQENLLGQLLRKKLEPGVEDWIHHHVSNGNDGGANVNGVAGAQDDTLSKAELRELWTWAPKASAGIVGPMLEDGGDFDDDYTIAEREAGVENVVTGLKRKLDDGDSDEEDTTMEDAMPTATSASEDDVPGLDPSAPAVPIDSILRFITTGLVQPNVRPNR